MQIKARTRFFDFFRSIFKFPLPERLLILFTKGKGYGNFFVKCIPQNYQYKKETFRNVHRDGINFRLDISEYMEWVIYFGLSVEKRAGLYPLIETNMVVFDVGSNIGETLLHFALLTGDGGKVYGFEPVPENFKKCTDNISINKFKNIKLSNTALSDKREKLYFAHAENMNSGGIFMNKEKRNSGHEVQALTLDEFVHENKINGIDLIKIDVEGFELNVLKGAADTLQNLRPLIFAEVDEKNLQRQGTDAATLISFIRSFRYDVQPADGSNPSHHYDIICKPIS